MAGTPSARRNTQGPVASLSGLPARYEQQQQFEDQAIRLVAKNKQITPTKPIATE
jgi:hypothetical protein